MSSKIGTRKINNALATLEEAKKQQAMTKDQMSKLKTVCRSSGVGVSKARQEDKANKEKWLKSAAAKKLMKAMPNDSNAVNVAWSVSTGKRIRPKKYETAAFDDALDYIADKIL
jgi:23S rRNA pseudoU1915 N3-methylase RlmH